MIKKYFFIFLISFNLFAECGRRFDVLVIFSPLNKKLKVDEIVKRDEIFCDKTKKETNSNYAIKFFDKKNDLVTTKQFYVEEKPKNKIVVEESGQKKYKYISKNVEEQNLLIQVELKREQEIKSYSVFNLVTSELKDHGKF